MKTFKWEVSEGNFSYPSQIYGSKHYSLSQVWDNFTKSLHDYQVRSRISKYPMKNSHYENFWLDTSEYRCCRPEVFCRKSVLKNFAKFKGELLCQSLLFEKVAGLRPYFFIKNGTPAQVFSCEFCKTSKNTFFTEHLWWLLLWTDLGLTLIMVTFWRCLATLFWTVAFLLNPFLPMILAFSYKSFIICKTAS